MYSTAPRLFHATESFFFNLIDSRKVSSRRCCMVKIELGHTKFVHQRRLVAAVLQRVVVVVNRILRETSRAKHVADHFKLLRRRGCGVWKVEFDRLPLRILMAQLAHVVGRSGILLRTCIFSRRWGRKTQQAEDEEGTKGETKMRTHGGTSHDEQNDPLRRYHCQ